MGTRFRIEPAEKRVTMKFLIVLACFLAVGCAECCSSKEPSLYGSPEAFKLRGSRISIHLRYTSLRKRRLPYQTIPARALRNHLLPASIQLRYTSLRKRRLPSQTIPARALRNHILPVSILRRS